MIHALYKALLRGPRFRGRHRLENLLRRMLMPPVDTVDGVRMELDPQEWLQIHMLAGQPTEPATTALFRRLLKAGDTYIDIGAHVGFHALAAAQCVGPTGRVLAVEPQPYNCAKLLINSQINGLTNILVVMSAAGDSDGMIVLHDQKRNDKARLSVVEGAGISDVATRFEVPIQRIDTLHERHAPGPVRLLKIDVEGYERQVLSGAAATLEVTENLVFECLPDSSPEMVAELVATLTGAGFSLRQVDGSPWTPGGAAIEHNVWAARA
ncbi:FkbM family methyltransferase [Caulobacter ginsengisoli]|uniref:FkbM family methyltransferase n=1 Tax=Caulobacter ginsengisoli TaxID=400775 RepID=A0ABU0IM96_9CAUL|nr:FkbM family methyltransferase [Caulobacter ginsengisoli]MDQ0463130.1 FkbM family methyltransferase [Caulobacter ginsengisoli]